MHSPLNCKELTEALEVGKEANLDDEEMFEVEDLHDTMTRRASVWQQGSRDDRRKMAIKRLQAASKVYTDGVAKGVSSAVVKVKWRDTLQQALDKARLADVQADDGDVHTCFEHLMDLKSRLSCEAILTSSLSQLAQEEKLNWQNGNWRDLLSCLKTAYNDAQDVLANGPGMEVLPKAQKRIAELNTRLKALAVVHKLLEVGPVPPLQKRFEALRSSVQQAVHLGVQTFELGKALDGLQILQRLIAVEALEHALADKQVDRAREALQLAKEVDVEEDVIKKASQDLANLEAELLASSRMRRDSIASAASFASSKTKKQIAQLGRSMKSADIAIRRAREARYADESDAEAHDSGMDSELSQEDVEAEVASVRSGRSSSSKEDKLASTSMRESLLDAENHLDVVNEDAAKISKLLQQADSEFEHARDEKEQVLNHVDEVDEDEFEAYSMTLANSLSENDDAMRVSILSFVAAVDCSTLKLDEAVTSAFTPFEVGGRRVMVTISVVKIFQDNCTSLQVGHEIRRSQPGQTQEVAEIGLKRNSSLSTFAPASRNSRLPHLSSATASRQSSACYTRSSTTYDAEAAQWSNHPSSPQNRQRLSTSTLTRP